MKLSGWGRYPVMDCRTARPRDEARLRDCLQPGPLIARGAGRAYGDSALSPGLTVEMARFDRLLDFDPETGVLTAEAGVLLGDVIVSFLPRGWFPPVTPGTKFVTVGGMIAADVHGKNHHRAGSFGAHVLWIDLMTASGETTRCSPDQAPELFAATIGGMGLTGLILRAAFRMIPVESAWVRQETIIAEDLEAAMAAFEANAGWTYSVAWIDCQAPAGRLGRSVLFCGEHARGDELDSARRAAPFRTAARRALRVPLDAPAWTLSGPTIRAFNALYFRKQRHQPGSCLVDWDSFFYPLDAIIDWNRLYGRRGFAQFQCVIPLAESARGIRALLERLSASRQGSFLAVLKLLGPQAGGFSFPMEGYTLALDFPITARSLALMEQLDRVTLDHGGRFYLAKDSRLRRAVFDASEPRKAAFTSLRRRIGAAARFASAQSERLAL